MFIFGSVLIKFIFCILTLASVYFILSKQKSPKLSKKKIIIFTLIIWGVFIVINIYIDSIVNLLRF